MKQKILGILAATALSASLAIGCATALKNVTYTGPSVKAEKVEKHLKEQVLGLGAIVFGDFEKVDEIRSCLILDLSSFDEKTEAIMAGVSQKGDILYMISGKSDIELTDYKENGYGSVDGIFIRYDENNAIKITNPTKEQLETANNIYELILDGYDKEVMSAEKTKEYTSSLKEYVKTSGERLEKLIEELKSYK